MQDKSVAIQTHMSGEGGGRWKRRGGGGGQRVTECGGLEGRVHVRKQGKRYRTLLDGV